MRRIAITLVALAGAAAAFAAPAAAYEIDPLTGQPVQSSYGQQPYYGQQYYGYGQQPYDQTYRPQATTIPRQVVPFSSRYGAGTIVISTAERRLYYTRSPTVRRSSTRWASGAQGSRGRACARSA